MKSEVLYVKWRNDYTHFESLANQVYIAGTCLLLAMFGDKCKDFDCNCECCKRWRFLEQLVENPFTDE